MLRRVLLMTALPGVVASQELHPIAMQQAETQPATLLQASTTPARSVRWHRALGTTALFSFGTALVAGAASGNLAKLMDETQCCPDGGQRNATWRTIDRTLVNVGIASYLG